MKKIILMVAIAIIAERLVWGESVNITVPEEYGSKVIIESTWGAGLGEFGFYNPIPASLIVPQSFVVGKDKRIYISDPVNLRINKYDENGKYLGSINLEKIGFTKDIKQRSSFEIKPDFDWAGSAIKMDDKNNIFIRVGNAWGEIRILKFSYKGKFIEENVVRTKEKRDEEHLQDFHIDKDDNLVINLLRDRGRQETWKKYTSSGVVGIDSNKTKKDLNISEKRYLYNGEVIGADKYKNIYVKEIMPGSSKKVYEKNYTTYCINKYNPSGKKVYSFPTRDYAEKNNYLIEDEGTVYELRVAIVREKFEKPTKKTYPFGDFELEWVDILPEKIQLIRWEKI